MVTIMAAMVDEQLLFPSFLDDHRTYALVQTYWRRQVSRLLEGTDMTFQSFYNDRTGDGSKLYDANPIFDAYFPDRHKLIRIIQFIPEPGDTLFSSWQTEWPGDATTPKIQPTDPTRTGQPIPELVIDLALTRETAAQAVQLIRDWLDMSS